jgi:hypothetical protein
MVTLNSIEALRTWPDKTRNKKLEIRNKKVARSKSLQLLQGRVKKLCNLAHRGWRGRHATAVAFYVRGNKI